MKKHIITSIALASLLATVANADSRTNEFSREGKWEAYAFAQAGTAAILDQQYGGGVGIGYNVMEQLCLNCDLSLNSFSIDTLFFGQTDSLTIYTGGLSLDYNILKKPFTPFITAGVGYAFSDEGSSPTANLGIGLRYDVSDRVVLKAAYRPTWWFDSDGSSVFHMFSIAVGYKF